MGWLSVGVCVEVGVDILNYLILVVIKDVDIAAELEEVSGYFILKVLQLHVIQHHFSALLEMLLALLQLTTIIPLLLTTVALLSLAKHEVSYELRSLNLHLLPHLQLVQHVESFSFGFLHSEGVTHHHYHHRYH